MLELNLVALRPLTSPRANKRSSVSSDMLAHSSPEIRKRELKGKTPPLSAPRLGVIKPESPAPTSPKSPRARKGWWGNFHNSKEENNDTSTDIKLEVPKLISAGELTSKAMGKKTKEEPSNGKQADAKRPSPSSGKRGHRRSKSWWWGDKEQEEKQQEKEQQQLKQEIEEKIKRSINPEHRSHPWRTTDTETEAVRCFIREVRKFQDSLIEEIESNAIALITEGENCELEGLFESDDNIQKLVFCFPTAEREFYEEFLLTQHFTVFSEKFTDKLKAKLKVAIRKKLVALEQSLFEEEKQKASALSVLKIYKGGNAKVDIPAALQEELAATIMVAEGKIEVLHKAVNRLSLLNTRL